MKKLIFLFLLLSSSMQAQYVVQHGSFVLPKPQNLRQFYVAQIGNIMDIGQNISLDNGLRFGFEGICELGWYKFQSEGTPADWGEFWHSIFSLASDISPTYVYMGDSKIEFEKRKKRFENVGELVWHQDVPYSSLPIYKKIY